MKLVLLHCDIMNIMKVDELTLSFFSRFNSQLRPWVSSPFTYITTPALTTLNINQELK